MKLDWTQGNLAEGLRCYRDAHFFEAHEFWEIVWLNSPEPEKTFLQGIIQVAAAFHHLQRGNALGTASLLSSALRRLDCYPARFQSIQVAPFRAAIREWLSALETRSARPAPAIPAIEVTADTGEIR